MLKSAKSILKQFSFHPPSPITMTDKYILKLHWRLFFPLVFLLWIIIGITIVYFVSHEKQRQRENLENRLLNVNNTVMDAYERGVNLQNTVDFIRLFTDNTTLAPLRITVYDNKGNLVADNAEETIPFYDEKGELNPEFSPMLSGHNSQAVTDVMHNGRKSMISSKKSADGVIYSFSALPFEEEVTDFLSIDPMIWIAVILLGIFSSVLAYFGVRAVCRNVYTLQNFARAVASDNLPDNIDSMNFSNDELGEVSKNLLTVYRDRINAEQEKLHHERQILMNISHELNTPSGIIKGYLDTLMKEGDSMPAELKHKFLQRASQNTDRLIALIKDIATLMRLQENPGATELTPVDMLQLADRLAGDIKLDKTAAALSFHYDIPPDCYVLAQETLLTNVLINLINNAARYSDGTRIEFRWLRRENGMHYFEFSDNGKGVDMQHLPHLFDLFYRVDFGRSRKTGGSGLGLPLVLRIITALGGHISVANRPEGGLGFRFSLKEANVTLSGEQKPTDTTL